MGAARHIGRVGGLAVALGVGTAILTGYGVASAEPLLPLRHRRRRNRHRIRHRRRVRPRVGLLVATLRPPQVFGFNASLGIDADFLGLIHRQEHTVRIGIGRRLDNPTSYEVGPARRGGEHRRRATSSGSSGQRRFPRWPPVHRHLGEPHRDNTVNTADPRSRSDISSVVWYGTPNVHLDAEHRRHEREDVTPRRRREPGGLSSVSASVIASPSVSSPTAVSKNVDPNGTMAGNEVGVKEPSLTTTWLSSPRVLAGRAATPDSSLSSSSTATSGLVTSSALMTMQTATPVVAVTAPTIPSGAASQVVNLVNEVLNPFAGNGPAAPVDSPTEWILVAAVRRESLHCANHLRTGNHAHERGDYRHQQRTDECQRKPAELTVVGVPAPVGRFFSTRPPVTSVSCPTSRW